MKDRELKLKNSPEQHGIKEDGSFEFFLSLLNDVADGYRVDTEGASKIRNKVMEEIRMNKEKKAD